MGSTQMTVFFLLGLLNFSLARVCPGCPLNRDANDPAVYQYLSDKLKNSPPQGLKNSEQTELVRINEVDEQVVSGWRYSYNFEVRGVQSHDLYDCTLVRYVQLWKGEEQVTEYSCHPASSNRNKRSTILGGEFLLDVENNSDLKELESLMSQGIAKTQNSKYFMKIVKYFKATEQIVSGSIIRATVEVANTNCLQSQSSNTDKCKIQDKDHHVCEVEVLLKPWMKIKEVTRVQCRPHPNFCAGCPVESNPDDAVVQQCLLRTLSNLNAGSHSSRKLSLIKIKKVVSQVISGIKYTVEFDANDETSTASLTCKAVIISQPWITEDPIVEEFDCTPNSSQ